MKNNLTQTPILKMLSIAYDAFIEKGRSHQEAVQQSSAIVSALLAIKVNPKIIQKNYPL